MKKLFVLFILFTCYRGFAQETLSTMSFNPRLYYATTKLQRHPISAGYKEFVMVEDSNILVESDTLTLPFVDDFSYNYLKPYNYSSYIYATVYNAIGSCDTSYGVHTITDTFSLNQTYIYSYNLAAHKIDSTPTSPITFLNSPGFTGNCFYNMGDTAILYPRTNIYTFDTTTGNITAQVRDTTNVLIGIIYAPVLYKSKAPLYTKWLDNYAYQNYTNGYLPPSIGVVSLDGLNEFGQPYNKNNPTNHGIADQLTSKPINLSGLTDADSVYFSFFYQPGGFADVATTGDSLVLEFYNGFTNTYDHIWSMTGDSVIPDTADAFRQVVIRIPSTNLGQNIEYLFNGFQFRFLNYGSLTGNNDIWNIDYVRLDKNRTYSDTTSSDIAFQYQLPSILKNYTEMPAWQFVGTSDLIDSITIYISNLNQPQAATNPPATNYTISADQVYPSPLVLLTPISNTFNAGLENTILLYPSAQYASPTLAVPDSVVIQSQAVLNINDIQITKANDTIRKTQTLSDVLAYDDGSAEFSYGVQYLGTNKFAYDFDLHHPDSLVGFQVLFANADVDVHDLVFNFNLWYRIDTQNVFFADTPIFVSNNEKPFYIDSVNGFATYKIAPIALPSHFYFGYSQADIRNLQIGYDVNSAKGRPHMYIYSSSTGVWQKSTIYTNGSPMIRLLLGHSYQIASGVNDIATQSIKVYPNPTSGILTFDLPSGRDYSAELYDIMGRLSVMQSINTYNNIIDISGLIHGMYLLHLTDTKTGIIYQNKIVKTND